MNKQQLIRVLKEQLDFKGNYNDYLLDSKERINAVGNFEGITLALSLIDQLEEPEQEKVVIPQFVADWIEHIKKDKPWLSLYGVFNYSDRVQSETTKWLSTNNSELFARAWLDGYTVEKEKLYKVKLSKYDYLVQDGDGTVFTMDTGLHEYEDRFTEQEIKNIDERYWAFAEEVTK